MWEKHAGPASGRTDEAGGDCLLCHDGADGFADWLPYPADYDREGEKDNRVIAPLFVADRLDHLLNEVNGILHKVEEGITVISDRYYFSSYAYQGVDLPMDWVIRANEPNSSILRPALTVFLDIPPKLALERISRNRFQQELFEEEARLVQVRQKYMEAFRALEGEEQVAVLDGDKSPQAVAEAIWEEVRKYMID